MVGVSLIRDSYRWILEGNAYYHAGYWSHLLSELARKDSQQEQKLEATARQASRHAGYETGIANDLREKAEAISQFWFFLFFLLSSVYLWMERKLS